MNNVGREFEANLVRGGNVGVSTAIVSLMCRV